MIGRNTKKPFDQMICILLYGFETWTSNVRDENVLKAL